MIEKILLVTLFDDNNIGNRLQNFALQQILRKYGVKVETVDNYYTMVPSLRESLKAWIKGFMGVLGSTKYKKKYQQFISAKRRRMANRRFDQTNLSSIRRITNADSLKIDWSEYDLAIVGSDQIWHKWKCDPMELPFYYLQFMPCDKRIAYGASFGFEEFPPEDMQQHIEGLSGMKYISCREQTGCNLVHKTIGRRVLKVLDPTLLLETGEWREIENQSGMHFEKQTSYAFLYFLGNITDEYWDYMNRVMLEKGIDQVIDFFDLCGKEISSYGPSGFLYLIDHADYVFTDSFHCTVFSVLFGRNFTVFKRTQRGFEQMFSRIEEFLSSTDNLEHIYGGTSRKATGDFEKLYLDSINYIETVLEIEK